MFVVVNINIMLLHLFVQLLNSPPVLLSYSLVSMRTNLGASFALILSHISDRRELSLSEHKSENWFFLVYFSSLVYGTPERFNSWVVIR